MEGDARWAPLCQIPIVLLTQNTVEPGVCTASFPSECALGLSRSLGWENARRHSRGLVVKEEQGKKEGMNDIAVEAEGPLFTG